MKKIVLSILAVLILLNYSSLGFCQESKLIDINYSNKLLSDVLKDLADKFSVDVVLSSAASQSITCSVKNVSIEDALDLVLCGTNFDFTKPNSGKNTYLVFKTEKSNCRVGQKSKIFPLTNIEANYVSELLPDNLRASTRIINEQNSLIAEGTYNDLKRIEEFIKDIDKPLKQVELEVKLIEIKRNALRDLRIFNDQGFLIGKIRNGLGIFDFSHNEWLLFNRELRYLERVGLAHVHAYPKVVSLSGRTAMININQDTNIILGQGIGFGEQQLGVVQTQRLEKIVAGTNLSITPVIGQNGLITTAIGIEVSDNSGKTTQNGVTIPTTTLRRQINSEVQVKDGQTVALGGLVTNNNSVDRQGLPFITGIPIIGDILSNRSSLKNQSELIVLITPRIRSLNEESITLRKLPQSSLIENEYIESAPGQVYKKKRWFSIFKSMIY